jgi:purine-nucleoside phosphorylase
MTEATEISEKRPPCPGSREAIARAVDAVRPILAEPPVCFGILGSGLGALIQQLEDPVYLPFKDIPGFPSARVTGHAGELVFGYMAGCPVLVQSGRFHGYEGHAPDVVAAPVRLAAGLEISTLLVTNAAGGIHRLFPPGTLMLISDHLNLTGASPLTGAVRPGEIRFPDMSTAYDGVLRDLAHRVALEAGIRLEEGVYAGLTGPAYETPAEVRMLRLLGADAVGMSTVHEVIAARALGMRVLGVSLITNTAAGLALSELDHTEVLEAGAAAAPQLQRLIRGILARVMVNAV